ncbi:MAG TPA: hypothetical protein VGV09_02440, partial [Steroidobacteraceae bacterium]|nr:hypothetical protein [Steroidobacteraceae bacterium]
VCTHAQRYEIELALVSGVSHCALGKKYGVSHDSVQRHAKNHVSADRRAQLVAGPMKPAELAQKASEKSATLLDHAEIVRNSLMLRFLAAAEADDRTGSAMVAGRVIEALRFIAQLTGEITKASATITNNTLIINSPFMADLQGMLARKLAPFPEARAAVLAGLEDLSRKAAEGAQDAPIYIPPALPALDHVSG